MDACDALKDRRNKSITDRARTAANIAALQTQLQNETTTLASIDAAITQLDLAIAQLEESN